MEEYDLSNKYFYARWPHWLRWTLFLPTAVLGCVIVPVLFNIAIAIFIHPENNSLNHGWYYLISSAILGVAFVGIAAYVAPRKQFEVGLIMLIILSIAIGMLWARGDDIGYFHQTKDMLYYSLHDLASVVAGVVTLFAIKAEIQNNSNHQLQEVKQMKSKRPGP